MLRSLCHKEIKVQVSDTTMLKKVQLLVKK